MKLVDLYSRLSPVFRPLGFPYAFLMRQRRTLYGSGWLSGYRPSCPTVSIGNISWGGTGKTPLTAWMLAWAETRGVKAVVLSRGYGGNPGKRPLLVRPDTPVAMAGDEPLLLARTFPAASVVVFRRRSEAARFAENHLSPDLIILEDGLQHLRVWRDADIVLLRPEDLHEEWNRVIPSGTWREGRSALKAASVFVVKAGRGEWATLQDAAGEKLSGLGKPVFPFTLEPRALRALFPVDGETEISPEIYRNTPYILMSGVGSPGQVEATAEAILGRAPLQHFDFSDHHSYDPVEIQAMLKIAAAPVPVVCTAKDAVKLERMRDVWGLTPVWVLETGVQFGPALAVNAIATSSATFADWWQEWWSAKRSRKLPTGGGHVV